MIRLVNAARAEGIEVSARQVFRHRTPAALAAVVDPGPARTGPEPTGSVEAPGGADGAVPETPVLHALREAGSTLRDLGSPMLLDLPAGVGRDVLAGALQALLDRHGVLRARLVRDDGPDRPWTLHVPAVGSVDAHELIERVDLADGAEGADGADTARLVREHTRAADRALDPDAGIMLRAVWFDAGPDRPGRLLVLVHHLAVDGVSWQVLTGELAAAGSALASGAAVDLAPVGLSFREWAVRTRAAVPDAEADLATWCGELVPGAELVAPGTDTTGPRRTVLTELGAGLTADLLAVPGVRVDDVLLTALGVAVADRRRRAGSDRTAVGVSVQGHGRHARFAGDADLSGTVGWFADLYPVRVDVGPVDPAAVMAGDPDAAAALGAVTGHLDALPDQGAGYAILRHLDERTAPVLAAVDGPQVGWNHQGRAGAATGGPWRPAADADALLDGWREDPADGFALSVVSRIVESPGGPEVRAWWSAAPESVL